MRTNSRLLIRLKYFLMLLVPVLLAACSNPTIKNPTPLSSLPQAMGAQEYQIQPGDDLDIRFFYNPELNEQQRVRPDGRIALQLV